MVGKEQPLVRKIYNDLSLLKEFGILNSYKYFTISKIFRVFFHTMLTIISMELLAFYSGVFTVKMMQFQEFVAYVIFLPMLFSLLILTLLVIYSIRSSIRRVANQLRIISGINNKRLRIQEQSKMYRIYMGNNFKLLIMGVMLHVLYSFFVYLLLTNKLPFLDMGVVSLYISNERGFMWYILITSSFFGLLWNLAGYFSNKRTDWSAIFDNIKTCPYKGFQSLFLQVLFEALALCTVVGHVIFAFLRIVSNNNQVNELLNENSLTWLNIIVSIIFFLILTYVKMMIKLQFSKDSDKIFYPYYDGLVRNK